MRLSSLHEWGHGDQDSAHRPRHAFVRQRTPLSSYLILAILVCVAVASAVFVLRQRGGTPLPTVAQVPARPEKLKPVSDAATVRVLIARRKIEKGTPLTPDLFEVSIRQRAALPGQQVVEAKELEGAYAAVTIPALYPLVQDYVVDDRASRTITRKIPEGARAVTIHTSVVNSVEGWARAGSKVDVQWVGLVNGQLYSKIVVQNAEVLSIERKLTATQSPSEPDPATATLLVSEADAERLTVVTGIGDLILQLRGSDDDGENITTKGVLKQDDLFVRRMPSINDRLQGVARIPGKEDGRETWALLDGKWVKRTTP